MTKHRVVSPEAWEIARKALLVEEKALTRRLDALAAARRALPWERVEKSYVFDGPTGETTLGELFAGRSQLVVYHFMFAPEWADGCKSCSFWADSIERNAVHLAHRDATIVAISRAPLAKLVAAGQRFGWTFPWVSSGRTDFNHDYRVSFEEGRGEPTYNYAPKTRGSSDLPGISVFVKDDDGTVYRTYSAYARGIEAMNATYSYLDLLPKGRDEGGLAHPMAWVRLRDQYDVAT